MVSFRVRAVAESRANVSVRLWLGPELGQGWVRVTVRVMVNARARVRVKH